MTERTLVLIKPDGVKRRLIGEILSRIEGKGLTIAALELKNVSDDLARRHYAEHEGKPFFASLLEFITSGPVVAAIVEGPRAVAAFRQIAGATDPVEKAAPGTIRGDLALVTQDNLVHGSDSPESAAREIDALVSRPIAGFARPGQSATRDVGYWARVAVPVTRSGCPNEDLDERDHRDRGAAPTVQPSFRPAPRRFRSGPLGARP